MANALQVRTIRTVVDQYVQELGLPPHKAFLYLVIERFLADLELNSIDIEEAIVDGSDDCGIDAIVIDDESNSVPHIYFFQSKYSPKDDAFERNFEGDALGKIQSAVDDFVLKGRINSSYQNERLVDKLHSVKNLLSRNPIFVIVLCSNSLPPAKSASARLEEFRDVANSSVRAEHIRIEYIDVDRVALELIAAEQTGEIDINLAISGRYLTENTGNAQLLVGPAEAAVVAKIVEDNGNFIFERNVRGYLGKQKLNERIYETATNQDSPYFVYMNNGITITCTNFTHAPVTESPTLDIKNAQIVNGQQTARSLHRAWKEGKLRQGTKVLVRVVESSDHDLLMKIVDSTNSQTKVTSRDLHSNDDIQRLIEKSLVAQGYFYEARKNKYKGKETGKRIDAETAAQVYYAVFRQQPALAKDKKKEIFGEKYDEIFNSELKPEDILYSFHLLKKVKSLIGDTDSREYTFLKDATLHIATILHRELSIANEDVLPNLSGAAVQTSFRRVIEALKQLVEERRAVEGDKYEHRRTFKDIETYGRAVEILATNI